MYYYIAIKWSKLLLHTQHEHCAKQKKQDLKYTQYTHIRSAVKMIKLGT